MLNMDAEPGLLLHVSLPEWKLDLTSLQPLRVWIKAGCPNEGNGSVTMKRQRKTPKTISTLLRFQRTLSPVVV
jgi:hypothetical protein